jgi:hypothetical protein
MRDTIKGLDRFSRVVLASLAVVALPILWLVANNLDAGFFPDRSAYEHLGQIARVYDGKPLYAPMSIEHCPITYPPLYWLLCGWLWHLTGPSVQVAQLVSLAATAALVWIIGRFVWDLTDGDVLLTFAAAIDVLLVSVFTTFWTCRIIIDPLHFALAVAGFYCLTKPGLAPTAAAAALLSLGALTKQTGLAYVAAGFLAPATRDRRQAAIFAIVALTICGGAITWLQWTSGGMFYTITVTENRGPPWIASRLLNEVWGVEFLGHAGILLLLTLWPVVALGRLSEARQWLTRPEYVMAASGLFVASVAHPKLGSGNVHGVIAFAGLIVCGLHGVHKLALATREGWPGIAFRNCVVALQALTFVIPAWNEGATWFIDLEDRQRFARITSVFREGPTVMYHFPYLSRAFGHRDGGHQGTELCRWVDGKWNWSQKPDFLNTPYREQAYDHVILCASVIDDNDPTIRTIRENYTVTEIIPAHSTRPNTLMLRYPLAIMTSNRLASTKTPGSAP